MNCNFIHVFATRTFLRHKVEAQGLKIVLVNGNPRADNIQKIWA